MQQTSIPVIGMENCEFRKEAKTLIASASLTGGTFPRLVDVHSHHTNRKVTFRVDQEAAVAAEFWDGEECHYVPLIEVVNVTKLIISRHS